MEFIRIDISGPVATITIDRPKALNALTPQVLDELSQALEVVNTDEVRAVILTGAGEKAFAAGADIKEFPSFGPFQAQEFAVRGQNLTRKLEAFPKPVIAAINGFALGGGCELALACHMRVASEKAKLGQPEVNLGVMAGFGGSQRLPRLVGKGVALEMLTTGRVLDATEALRVGLVNAVTTAEELLPTCIKIGEQIAGKAPRAVALTLEAVNRGLNMTLEEGLNLEAQLFALTFTTEDMQEGTRAFIDKRKPKFTGK
ncbi:MAG: enoyl-CoA hydratase/isomerase family protein [Fidelibacterota bacterium]|nr:MAG: enoyl-CoA hydratase/isomerase family protein [Candidatus Neomarinimicrobiota bacterium]